MSATLSRDNATLEFRYLPSRISASMVINMGESFQNVLSALTVSPSTPIGKISLLSQADERMIWTWNKPIPARIPECVHQRVEAQVRLQPGSEAICSFDRDFTYSQLDDAAGRLANHLVKQGVGPGVFVPLCFDKSSWAIVAMYAVLKAGGACVSVSPSYPPARMAVIMDDLEKKVVVLTSPSHAVLFAEYDIKAFSIDANLLESISSTPAYTSVSVSHLDPAFVIYTSGSTGMGPLE